MSSPIVRDLLWAKLTTGMEGGGLCTASDPDQVFRRFCLGEKVERRGGGGGWLLGWCLFCDIYASREFDQVGTVYVFGLVAKPGKYMFAVVWL